MWCWGLNNFGQLGNGTTTSSSVPVQVKSLTGVVRIGGARDHTLAVKANGTVWAWGDNDFGQLGDGTTTDRLKPVRVTGVTGGEEVAGGRDYSVALVQP